MARLIFRILKTSEGPMIIPERTYPETADYVQAFQDYLKEKGWKMGVEVYVGGRNLTIYLPESRNGTIYSDTLFGAQKVETPTETTK